MSDFFIEFRVDYSDTDAMGIVHHANYFRWFERARVEWLRDQGHSYAQLEHEGYSLPVLSASIHYRKSLRFDDTARVTVKIATMTAAILEIDYQIRLNDELTTEGQTRHALCQRVDSSENDSKNQLRWKMIRFPREWREKWLQPKEPKT